MRRKAFAFRRLRVTETNTTVFLFFWQSYRKRTAFSVKALNFDFSAVGFYYCADDSQTYSNTARLAVARLIRSVKSFEYEFLLKYT